MPFQATCPGCQTALRVADETRGKKVRCSNCQTIFVAGGAAANGSPSSVKPARPAAPQASRPKAAAPGAIAKTKAKAAPRLADDEDDAPAPVKKKKSVLPFVLIGCGTLFLLCGGGASIAGYMIYKGLNSAAEAVQEKGQQFAEEFEKAAKEQERLNEQSRKDREKAEAIHKAGQEAQERARKEQQRIIDEINKGKNNPPAFPPNAGNNPPFPDPVKEPPQKKDENPMPPVKPPDTPRPPAFDPPKPPMPKPPVPQRETVQAVGVSIPLNALVTQVFSVSFSGPEKNQALVVLKTEPTKQDLHLARFDLATGKEVDGMDLPFDFGTSVRDFSPDGKYYLQNNAGTPYSIYAWPNPTPIVNKWLPKAPKADTQGLSNTVVAAYLLEGDKLLTVNGVGQVVRWAIPAAPGGEPMQDAVYVPPPAVARYTLGMGYGLTAISPDRKKVAVYNGSDGYFVVDTGTMDLAAQVKSPEDGKPRENTIIGILGVAFSPDGTHLASMFQQTHLQPPRQPRNPTPPRTTTPPSRTKRPPKGKAPAPAPAGDDMPAPAAGPGGPTLVRWDLQTQQVVSRVTDSSRGAGFMGTRLGWWGMDYCWASYPSRHGSLFSWEKKAVAMQDTLRPGSRIFSGSPDGKCWFVVNGPDARAVLKSVDLPADALKQADQPLLLTPDGIVKK